MMRLPLLAAALAMLVLGVSPHPARAQGFAAGGFDPSQLDKIIAQVHQVPLTKDMIDRFVASYPDMKAASAKFEGTELPEEPGEGGDLAALPPEKRKAMDEVAVKHGFKDLDEWSTVTSSIAMSYAYVREGKSPEELTKMVEAAVAQAESDNTMTEEQKVQAIAQYRKLGEKLAQLQPLPENVKLVEQMIGKVAPVMKIQ